MSLLVRISLLIPCLIEATRIPQPTPFNNSTRLSPSAPLVTAGPNGCVRDSIPLGRISWSQMSIFTTITAETEVIIVNARENRTRTSTIYNTHANNVTYQRPETNNAGTAIATVFVVDGDKTSYRTVAFPTTAYNDYAPSYVLCGNLSTIVAGKTTALANMDCVSTSAGYTTLNEDSPTFTFPSHPPIPEAIQPGLSTIQDPRGLTYQGRVTNECNDSSVLEPLFPGLGLWSCKSFETCGGNKSSPGHLSAVIHPNIALRAALYLTATSTSTEDSETTSTTIAKPTVTEHLSASPSLSPPEEPKAIVPGSNPTFLNPIPFSPKAPVSPHTNNNDASKVYTQSSPVPIKELPNYEVSPKAVVLPSATAFVPIVQTSTNAEGIVETFSGFAAATPIPVTSTNAEGKEIVTSSLAVIAPLASAALAAAILGQVAISSTNAEGDIVVLTGIESGKPVPATTIDAHGQGTAISDLLHAPIPEMVSTTVALTDAHGVVPATSSIPAMASTIAKVQGSQVIATSPLLPTVLLGIPPSKPAITSPPTLTIGGQTYIADSLNQYAIGGQTLAPGEAITVSGTRIALSPDMNVLSIGTSAEILATTTPQALTFGTQVVTANSLNQYDIDGQTLTSGGTITVSGTLVSLAFNVEATGAAIGTDNQGKNNQSGSVAGANGTAIPQASTGDAGIRRCGIWFEVTMFLLAVGMMIWL